MLREKNKTNPQPASNPSYTELNKTSNTSLTFQELLQILCTEALMRWSWHAKQYFQMSEHDTLAVLKGSLKGILNSVFSCHLVCITAPPTSKLFHCQTLPPKHPSATLLRAYCDRHHSTKRVVPSLRQASVSRRWRSASWLQYKWIGIPKVCV